MRRRKAVIAWALAAAGRIAGDFDDPKISVLPPSQVAAGTPGILERILKAPVKLIGR